MTFPMTPNPAGPMKQFAGRLPQMETQSITPTLLTRVPHVARDGFDGPKKGADPHLALLLRQGRVAAAAQQDHLQEYENWVFSMHTIASQLP